MFKESKKGSVLLYVIMIFCLMTILGLGLVALTNHNTKMTKIEMDSEQVYQSALSGLETTLDSFEKDPETGTTLTEQIRGGAGVLNASLDMNYEKMGNINISIACAEGEEVGTCKKLKVDSTAKLNGLSRTVTGYIDVIEGGMEFPVSVDIYDQERGYFKDGNSLYCQFGSQTEVSTDCEKGASPSFKGKYKEYEKTPNESDYKSTINELASQAKGVACPASGVIDKSCTFAYDKIQSTSYEIDNTKSDIILDMEKVVNVNNSNFTLKDPDSSYSVIILTKLITFNNSQIGTSLKDSDNILILAKETNRQEFIASSQDMEIYSWIVNPYGAKDSDMSVIITAVGNKIESNLYGGVYAGDLFQSDNVNIYGVQPSNAVLALFKKLGLELSGGGGAMTFAKTYDK